MNGVLVIVLLTMVPFVAAETEAVHASGGRTIYVSTAPEQYSSDEFTDKEIVVYQSLREAVGNLRKGDELVLDAGVYRDSIDLSNLKGVGGTTVIRGRSGSDVVIKGSDLVDGWRSLGDGLFVKDGWQINSQQVYVNGNPLTQVGGEIYGGYPSDLSNELHDLHKRRGIWPGRLSGNGANDMETGSFFYDMEAKKLYIKLEPDVQITDAKVEVSIRTYLLNAPMVDDLEISDIRFEHSNTSAKSRSAAVRLLGSRIRVNGMVVRLADSVGLVIRGNDNIVENSVFEYNGRLGMVASGRNVRLINNSTNYNNTRGFNPNWAAGGIKLVGGGGLKDSRIEYHVSIGNNGDGIWFDWKSRANVVSNSVVVGNNGHGLHYEASFSGEFHDNLIFNNAKRGIYLPNSSNCSVHHNLIILNGLEQVATIYSGRQDPEGETDFSVHGNRILRNVIGWGRSNRPVLVLPRKRADNTSNQNIFIYDKKYPVFSLGWPRLMSLWKAWDLREWIRHSDQDRDSIVVQATVPRYLLRWRASQPLVSNLDVVRGFVERAYQDVCHASDLAAICKGRLPWPASYALPR